MVQRTAEAEWRGALQNGEGTMKLGGGAYEGPYTFGSRFAEDKGTNPEELIAAAHAGCFSMAFSGALGRAGFPPKRVHTSARVTLEKVGEGFSITRIELETEADVPGIGEEQFTAFAEDAKRNCPVSRALAVQDIRVRARLLAR